MKKVLVRVIVLNLSWGNEYHKVKILVYPPRLSQSQLWFARAMEKKNLSMLLQSAFLNKEPKQTKKSFSWVRWMRPK